MKLEQTARTVALAMYDLERKVKAEGRIRNTTQGIFDRLRVTTTSGTGFVSGVMEGDDYWVFVGNGRGPGGMPPVDNIQAWIDRAGLTISAFAVARKIAKEGTRAHRRGEANVFTSVIDQWEQDLGVVEDVAGKEMEDATFDVVVRNITK